MSRAKNGDTMNASAVLIVLWAALGQAPSTSAPPAEKGRDGVRSKAEASKPDTAAKSLDELKHSAARYRIAVDSDPPRDLVFVPEPVLSWTNPLRRTFTGGSFIWVADGRPEVVGSFYRYTVDGKTVEDNEFQSLATTGLKASRDGREVWVPREAGIALAPIPGAPRPGASPSERLRQMRALANEFRAFFDTTEDKSELRLLPKPLYRYRVNRPDLSDGALFAFVLTTDPEVLLMIECRQVDGVAVWHYGFARMSMVNLRAQHKARNVWRVEWATDYRNPTLPYVTLQSESRSD
jgi:hypothetical protein